MRGGERERGPLPPSLSLPLGEERERGEGEEGKDGGREGKRELSERNYTSTERGVYSYL